MANKTFLVAAGNSTTQFWVNCTRAVVAGGVEWCNPSAYPAGFLTGAAESILHGRTVCGSYVAPELQALMGDGWELGPGEGVCQCSDSYAWNNDGAAGACQGNTWDAACISGTTGCNTQTVGTYLWLLMTLAFALWTLYLCFGSLRLIHLHSKQKNGFQFNATGTTVVFIFIDLAAFAVWMLSYPAIVITQAASMGTYIFKTAGIPFTAAFLSAFLLWTCLMWLNVVNASKRLKASGNNIKGPYVFVVAGAVAFFTAGILVGTFVMNDLQMTSMISLFSCLCCAITYLVVGSKVNALAKSLDKGGSQKGEDLSGTKKKKKRGGLYGIVDCARRQAMNLIFYVVAAAAYSFFPTNPTAFSTIGQPIMVTFMFSGVSMLQSTGYGYVHRIITANHKKATAVTPSSTVVTSTSGD